MTQAADTDPRKERPKLYADVMLGRLAKWLRILGFDVLYSNDSRDEELLETCKSEGRVLLTRDTELARRADKSIAVVSSRGALCATHRSRPPREAKLRD